MLFLKAIIIIKTILINFFLLRFQFCRHFSNKYTWNAFLRFSLVSLLQLAFEISAYLASVSLSKDNFSA